MNNSVVFKGCSYHLALPAPPSLVLLVCRSISSAIGWKVGSVGRWENRGWGHCHPGAFATLREPWTHQRGALRASTTRDQQTSFDLAKSSISLCASAVSDHLPAPPPLMVNSPHMCRHILPDHTCTHVNEF